MPSREPPNQPPFIRNAPETLAIGGLLSVFFAARSGLWGVLVIDMIQLAIMTTAMVAAAYFAVSAPEVGGLRAMIDRLTATPGPDGINYLSLLPDFTNHWDIAVAVFILPIAVQWWAVWYPGSEPGGASFIAQRMLASKSERDSLGEMLLFNLLHYVVRPWPWILVALASIIVFPTLADIQREFPHADPALIHHDIAYPAMMKFLPAGFLGLMVGAFIAAHSSTITTLLNWGSSYLVHDFYQRFVWRGATDKHYICVARLTTVALFVCGCLLTTVLDSARQIFDIILQIGAGTGLIYLLRWFWWRITAWCEVAAMVSSLAISVLFLILHKTGTFDCSTHLKLLLTVAFTTVCWVATAYLGPRTDDRTLTAFYRRVRPAGPAWTRIRQAAGIDPREVSSPADNIPLALAAWTLGCSVIWSALFAMGNLLYGRIGTALVLTSVSLLTGAALIRVLQRLWRVASSSCDKEGDCGQAG